MRTNIRKTIAGAAAMTAAGVCAAAEAPLWTVDTNSLAPLATGAVARVAPPRDGGNPVVPPAPRGPVLWTAEGSHTGPAGTGTWTANGAVQKTETGVEWNADRNGVTPNGQSWTTSTLGQGQKTDNGRTWNSTTTGVTDDRNWTTTREGELVRTGDGTAAIDRSATTTLDNGKVITRESETNLQKTPNGATWTTEGTTTTPGGTGNWTANGTSSRSENGVQWNVDRAGATAKGQDWSSTTAGSATQTGPKKGEWQTQTSGQIGDRKWSGSSEGSWKRTGSAMQSSPGTGKGGDKAAVRRPSPPKASRGSGARRR